MSQVILEPFEYLMANPGKDFRSKLIKSFDVWIHISTEKRDIIKDVINMLHNSSLLYFGLLSRIDDVEDQSELRRGSPVAHKIFGIPKTINSANYVYFLALQKTLELQSPVAIEVFTHELLQLHIGQGLEIHWRDSVQCPNVEDGLLRLAIKLIQNSNEYTKFVELVNLLGVHFQIRDDYVNLTSTDFQNEKGFAEDLTEGKFSYPIVDCFKHHPEKRSILSSILRQHTKEIEVKKYFISVLEGCGSFERTREFLQKLELDIKCKISELGGNSDSRVCVQLTKHDEAIFLTAAVMTSSHFVMEEFVNFNNITEVEEASKYLEPQAWNGEYPDLFTQDKKQSQDPISLISFDGASLIEEEYVDPFASLKLKESNTKEEFVKKLQFRRQKLKEMAKSLSSEQIPHRQIRDWNLSANCKETPIFYHPQVQAYYFTIEYQNPIEKQNNAMCEVEAQSSTVLRDETRSTVSFEELQLARSMLAFCSTFLPEYVN